MNDEKRSEEIACAVVGPTCSVFNWSMTKKRSSEISGRRMKRSSKIFEQEVRNVSFLCSCKLSLKYALLKGGGDSALEEREARRDCNVKRRDETLSEKN